MKAKCDRGASDQPQDVVELRDGTVLCGTIIFRQEGQSLIIVSDRQNRTIAQADIACVASAGAAAPEPARAAPPSAAAPTVESPPIAAAEPRRASAFSFVWDVRLVGTAFFKRYVSGAASAWSWGAGAGLGLGAALHYRPGSALGERPAHWFDLELGLAGSVTYDAWHELNAGAGPVIEQDASLQLGARLGLGENQSGPEGERWSGVVLGLAWLPTYVDFYGSKVAGGGTIHPAGIRVTFDAGSVDRALGSAPLLRVALWFLPYVGRLPSMLGLSAGAAFY